MYNPPQYLNLLKFLHNFFFYDTQTRLYKCFLIAHYLYLDTFSSTSEILAFYLVQNI